MKILYICADHGIPILGRRGCSTHVRETCRALSGAGHDVQILCSNRGNDDALDQDLRITEIQPRRLRKLGYDFRNAWHNLPLYRAARRLVEEHRIEAIYERFSLYSLVGTWTGRKFHLPRIVEVNAFFTVEHHHKLHFPRLARAAEVHVARHAPALVVVSQPLRDSLVEMGVPSQRVFIMPMAVDVDHFGPDPEAGRAMRERFDLGDRYVVGYVGSLSGWHGIGLLHDMAARIRRERQDFVIFVVGGQENHLHRHRREVQEAGLGEHLRFVGSVPYQDVPGCINAMDVALVPDTNYWTCPTKMFEYQAVGIPTIAPKYPAILDAMDHGEEGLLFEPRDVAAAVERILSLADDPERRHEMGRKARARVSATHSWQHNVSQVSALYRRMQDGEFMP